MRGPSLPLPPSLQHPHLLFSSFVLEKLAFAKAWHLHRPLLRHLSQEFASWWQQGLLVEEAGPHLCNHFFHQPAVEIIHMTRHAHVDQYHGVPFCSAIDVTTSPDHARQMRYTEDQSLKQRSSKAFSPRESQCFPCWRLLQPFCRC